MSRLNQSQAQRLLTLADKLHERVVGQDVAVESVSQAVLRSRAGLGRPHQPTGSFLFLGPTGVGKTELAKVCPVRDSSSRVLIHVAGTCGAAVRR